MVKRCMCVQEITKNLRLYTNDKRKIEKDPITLRCDDRGNKTFAHDTDLDLPMF